MDRYSRKGIRSGWLVILLGLFSPFAMAATEEQQVTLYAGEIPGAINAPDKEYVVSSDNNDKFIAAVSRPTLTAYLPAESNRKGAAVVICPGGGYFGLSSIKEGSEVAQRFAENGIAAFVLKYRLPDDNIMADKTTAPLQDVQQAIYQVRQHADQWHILPDSIGVMGFSAGGHLASTAATHFASPVLDNLTSAQVRPDFQILLYPVITMRVGVTHQGSRDLLLGNHPPEEMVTAYSNELQVENSAPQAFIVHSNDDEVVPVANALDYYGALVEHQVPVQLLLLPDGGHGYGMRYAYDWFESLLDWMDSRRLLAAGV